MVLQKRKRKHFSAVSFVLFFNRQNKLENYSSLFMIHLEIVSHQKAFLIIKIKGKKRGH